jgi:periplasmic protein TonB
VVASAAPVWERSDVNATPLGAKATLPLPYPLRRRPRLGALGGALLIEALIAGALLVSLAPKTVKMESRALQVSILAPPAPKPEPTPVPHQPLRLLLKQQLQPLVVLPLINLPVETAPPLPPHPVAVLEPRSTPPAHSTAEAMASFQGQVRQAVQTAVDTHYPAAARMLRQQGQTQVSFDYQDGVVTGIQVVQSSGLALLDHAAVATVRDARYPTPPPSLLHQQLNFAVWVKFRLATDS